jgi:cobalt-zinc-cadmium efflux system protein
VVEVVGGWLADRWPCSRTRAHITVAALSIAMFAQRLAQRPPSRRASYGYARAECSPRSSIALIMLALVV